MEENILEEIRGLIVINITSTGGNTISKEKLRSGKIISILIRKDREKFKSFRAKPINLSES